MTAAVLTAGCGLTGTEPNAPSKRDGRVTVGDTSRSTQSVTCTQNEWDVAIDATADPGRAHVFLRIGGQTPVVRTVNIQNLDGLSGVSGGDVGKADASTNSSSSYTITGTAVVTDAAHPAQTRNMPFKIDAPC